MHLPCAESLPGCVVEYDPPEGNNTVRSLTLVERPECIGLEAEKDIRMTWCTVICTYTHIHTHSLTRTHTLMYVHTHTHTHTHTLMYVLTHTHTHTHTHTYMHTQIRIHMCRNEV